MDNSPKYGKCVSFWNQMTILSQFHTECCSVVTAILHKIMLAPCTNVCYIHTYIFVVFNFDALAQASDIQIKRRQVVFLCWMQDLNPGSQTPNRQQTECSLTNRQSYRGSSLKLELDSPSLWSASIQPTWPHCQLTFAPGSGDIHICCC